MALRGIRRFSPHIRSFYPSTSTSATPVWNRSTLSTTHSRYVLFLVFSATTDWEDPARQCSYISLLSGAHSPPSRAYSPTSRSHSCPCVKRPRYPSCHLHWFHHVLFGNRSAGVYLSRLLRFGLRAFFLFVFFGSVYVHFCFRLFRLGLRAFLFSSFSVPSVGCFFFRLSRASLNPVWHTTNGPV